MRPKSITLSGAMLDALDTAQRHPNAITLYKDRTVQALIKRGYLAQTPDGLAITESGITRLANERRILAAPPDRRIGEPIVRELEAMPDREL